MRLNVPWGVYGIMELLRPMSLGNTTHRVVHQMHNKDVHDLKACFPGTAVYIKQKTAAFRKLENGRIGSDVYIIQQMLQAIDIIKAI